MIHTVRIDDSTPRGKQLVKDLRKYRKGVEFENPAVSGVIPEGYVTSEEFRSRVKSGLKKRLEENGYL